MENDCLMLSLVQLEELELPGKLSDRLTLLLKLNTIAERAAMVREQASLICEAVEAIEQSGELKRLLASTVETLNYMKSGVKNWKPLMSRDGKPSLKFQFIVDPGLKGLAALTAENPLTKLAAERSNSTLPGVFAVIVAACCEQVASEAALRVASDEQQLFNELDIDHSGSDYTSSNRDRVSKNN